MQEDPQAAERRRRVGIPGNIDPRAYDPRRAFNDPAAREKMVRAQAAARAQASAATTVVIATIVSLVTSAFGFVAAFAWNDALTKLLDPAIGRALASMGLPSDLAVLVKAIAITLIAVLAVVVLNRVAGRIAKKSAIDVAQAEAMM